ncbi:N-acetyl sugar amidotransferase [Pusillimonas sp. SM2304]|uniref:N-acetyl sugar amidotransferase n=1 Tax=Pusillimonas sp. SM2304 TaxID=3073241 RepID=UPI0028755CAF|nr:N-acetyl sugar amidotransferase [Pusillimonas sp. SM2304]MDS1140046.1 N-acetyl sugar amidotransferase [Pusillimonas sp. SM2304]
MSNKNYQMCVRCVMDTSDSEIVFDEKGVCSHCHQFDDETSKRWFPNVEGQTRLSEAFDRIKKDGLNNDYDCIIGLSGGIDSSYLALMLKDRGLRPLVVHVDGGWNSELAVYNIEQVVKYCNYDLHTHVINWEEMRDLQLAYLKSHVANQDVPQDHAFFSSLYHFAVSKKIKHVISGGNIATESVFPRTWHHSAMDAINLHAIHKKYGTIQLHNYKTINIFQYYLYYPYLYGMKTLRPLNFMDYNKSKALAFLEDTIGYKDYGNKHSESVFTKFFQNYYLPKKFGYDKRKMHYSSMILSGQLSREEAKQKLEQQLYDPRELVEDQEYIAKKLRISVLELKELVEAPGVAYTKYKNWDSTFNVLKKIQHFAEKVSGKNIKNYN